MTVAIQILFTSGWKELADLVLPVAKSYCEKHGYKFINVEYPEYPSDFGYNKLRWVINLFKENIDIVWCLDLDTMITNHIIRVEEFIDKENNFWICKDLNGINAGSFIIKKSEWSLIFLEYLLNQQGKENMHCEQDAIREYINTHDDHSIKILPHPSINSLLYENYPEFNNVTETQGQWQKGNFVLHVPGIGYEKRKEILTNIKEQIVYE